MVIIAVIKKNRCEFDKMEEYASPLLYRINADQDKKKLKNQLYDYIWSVIEPYIEFVTVDDDFLTTICQNMIKCFPDKNPDQFFYHTESSYSFPKKFTELIYAQPSWKEYQSDQIENLNNLGCLFSLKHNVIENTCIALVNNYDLSADKFTALGEINKKDIIKVVRRRFFYSAIVIKDDHMVKYYYQSPKYLITSVFNVAESDNIQKVSFSHLKYNLVFYFQQDNKKYVNKIATRINGSYRIYGDVIMIHEMEEDLFSDINLHEAKRLNVLSYGRLYDRKLKPEETHLVPDINDPEKKITPYWSRYIVSNYRMKNWQNNKNKCINCDKEIKNLIICQKCFRTRYCSGDCQKEFDRYHCSECLE